MKTIDLTIPLKQHFGFDTFKGDQDAIIQNVLAGKDTFVLMPTGGGKSLCYQLPALMMEGTAIVISPLIALMKNQVDAIRMISEDDGIAHFINSSLTKTEIDKVKQDILSGHTKLLYVAPESLTKEENVSFLKSVKISFYAVDEAHCISEWGHDFRIEYRRIRPIVNKIGPAPIIALTATATDKVRGDIMKCLGIRQATIFKSSFNRPNLYYEIRPKGTENEVNKEIVKFIRQHQGKSGIIYCLSRKRVEDLAAFLCNNNIKAEAYHAGMETEERNKAQDDFIMERVDVIVATIAFGMGIDKPDVRYVIHYDVPKSLEGYYQETGRAGRDGGEGICLTFYSRRDLQKLEKFMEGKSQSEQEIGRQLLQETEAYAESTVCRRKLLLHYFGEKYTQDNCGNCDNCLRPQDKVEAGDALKKALLAIEGVKEGFRENYIIDILLGRTKEDILAHQHDKLPCFGSGRDVSPRYWHAVIRQATLSDYLRTEVENYGVIKITPQGRSFMKKPVPFLITENRDFSEVVTDVAMAQPCALDDVLCGMLRGLRKDIANRNNVPPYVIFQDATLDAMATYYPVTIDELQNISGVGNGKAKRFGKEFCELILRYCEENEIERPDNQPVRNKPDKLNLTQNIVSKLDMRVPWDDIATIFGMEYEELLSKIEAMVERGMSLNIAYYVKSELDADTLEEIYDYFMESDSADLDEAVEALDYEYTEEEVRLARLLFLAEQGN